jgi:hypothetical protein
VALGVTFSFETFPTFFINEIIPIFLLPRFAGKTPWKEKGKNLK